MKKTIKRLPEAELDIMLALWSAPGPVRRSYFDQKMEEEKNWADSTILSLLSRLAAKGFIGVKKEGNRNLYWPLIQKQEYLAVENKNFLAKLHDSSLRHLVASMAETQTVSRAELEELQQLIERLKEEK